MSFLHVDKEGVDFGDDDNRGNLIDSVAVGLDDKPCLVEQCPVCGHLSIDSLQCSCLLPLT